ncbi:DEAD/DEAH box helicase [Hymenobacter negativus]|uniref:DNA 3'-5' helicase n=1 Tax=Hymenobacter negativus TaxID=2795026 RepID=A0ABS0Q5H9_9BACT|nr:DEAD/DEAH box helicase [Hymenobacter negativus]MBH8557916.1 ATP-dependent DNA helicase RecQ [Hymenobacter negativus]
MAQLHAGYFIEEILPFLIKGAAEDGPGIGRDKVLALLRSLSYFELESSSPLEGHGTEPDSLLAVAGNLVSRGMPTRAPLRLVAQVLQQVWPAEVAEAIDLGTIRYELGSVTDEWKQLLWRALHVVEPRIQDTAATRQELAGWASHGSDFERRFFTRMVPELFGPELWQVLAPQTVLRSLLEFAPDEREQLHKQLLVNASEFTEQTLDFTLALPYPWYRNAAALGSPPVQGVVVEIDGSQHRSDARQSVKDNRRDWATEQAGWVTARLATSDFDAPEKSLGPLREVVSKHTYLRHLSTNFHQPMHADEAGRRAMQLLLTPLAVARVQRTMIECMASGVLPMHKQRWSVAIIERDVPCGHLAVEGLQELFLELYELEGRERHLPEIDLRVYTTAEYATAELHQIARHSVRPLSAAASDGEVDLLLDVSMLQRPGFIMGKAMVPALVRLSIRTAYAPDTARRFQTAPLIPYLPIVQITPENGEGEYPEIPERKEPMLYFLRNIFRKNDFRAGQLAILSRGIQGKSVLGLLPTGGGKSLTYQLAVLLQPGVALVVDPIKSLMQDQFEGLHKNWIDATSYVNSSVRSAAQREMRLRRLSRGQLLFFFISPERMQIQSFRDQLLRMRSLDDPRRRVGFSYCVVDEAHCVSEWGHDFRTQYLRLGDNARTYCHTFENEPVPLYGLTATASFDVLADVERELKLDLDAVIRTKTNRRDELSYRIIEVVAEAEHKKHWDPVGAAKHQRLRELLYELPDEIQERIEVAERVEGFEARFIPRGFEASTFFAAQQEYYSNAGLIFCPYKSEKHAAGVQNVYTMLQGMDGLPLKVGYFMGSDQNDPDADAGAAEMELMQSRFVGDRLNLLVATKAFGMGIDKPNVRFTIHYNYPSSIESFVQEAGRAGRDQAFALNYVLFHENDSQIPKQFFQRSFKGRTKEALIMHELLTMVTFPAGQAIQELAEQLAATFHAPVSLNLYPKPSAGVPRSIYVNQAFGVSYGRVDFMNPMSPVKVVVDRHPSIDADLADAIIDELVRYLEEDAPDTAKDSQQAMGSWLAAHTTASSAPGIAPRLARVLPGQRPEPLTIGFTNGALSEMSEVAAAHGFTLPEPILRSAAMYAASATEFLNNLKSALTPQPAAEVFDTIRRNFLRIRDEQDTYKAVYRLCLLGVVEDYTIDYGSRTLTLILAPKTQSEDDYLNNLERYFSRYTSGGRARRMRNDAEQREKGDSLLEKCLGQILDFTYQEVSTKRLQAITEMEAACRRGLTGDDLIEYFDLYFNSKYARAEHLPEDLKQGTFFSQEIVLKYLRYMADPPDGLGQEKDNIKHLRGACTRLIQSAPTNGALLLLDGFATLFLEHHKPTGKADAKLVATGQQKIRDGLVAFYEQTELTEEELQKFGRQYAEEINRYDTEIGAYVLDTVVDEILLDINSRWLAGFNQKFDNRRF